MRFAMLNLVFADARRSMLASTAMRTVAATLLVAAAGCSTTPSGYWVPDLGNFACPSLASFCTQPVNAPYCPSDLSSAVARYCSPDQGAIVDDCVGYKRVWLRQRKGDSIWLYFEVSTGKLAAVVHLSTGPVSWCDGASPGFALTGCRTDASIISLCSANAS
jgi:hypothetical protein